MFKAGDNEGKAGWAGILRYSWFVVGFACLCVAAIVFFRWRENRGIDREIEQKKAAKRAEEDRRTVEAMGGSRFEILSFYSSPPQIRRGDSAQLCYGVSNAKAVRLDPVVEPMWPSLGRCVNVSPRKDTTYTLTAEDAAGDTKTATVAIRVR